VSLDDDGVLAEVLAGEVPIVEVEGSVVVDELGEVLDDLLIVSDLVVLSRVPAEVASESVQASEPLLEDNGLNLNLADGLNDDPLGHLLENKEALLDDVDLMSPADELVVPANEDLLELVPIPVVDTIEVVEVLQGVIATPVVE